MIRQQAKPPTTQRRFTTIWGELAYVCKKTRYWLYARKQRARAERYQERLAAILHDLPVNDSAIIREEGLALLHELRGELAKAIAHREREISLTERLHKEAQSHDQGTRCYMLQGRETNDLQQRREILAALKQAATQRNHAKPLKRNRRTLGANSNGQGGS